MNANGLYSFVKLATIVRICGQTGLVTSFMIDRELDSQENTSGVLSVFLNTISKRINRFERRSLVKVLYTTK